VLLRSVSASRVSDGGIAQSRLLSLLGHCDYSFHSQVRDIAKG